MLRLALMLTLCATPAYARDLQIPVKSGCISSPFGPRVIANHPQAGTYHAGVDLPAPEGSPVVAVAPGKLIRIQHKALGGLEVLVQHPAFVGVYSHLGSVEDIDGKSLKAGDKIGTVGNTGVTFGMHLYFAMLQNNQAVDPAPYLTLPMCDGHTHVTNANVPHVTNAKWKTTVIDKDGKVIPTRHYYVLERNGDLFIGPTRSDARQN
jgi:hypothetical protein